MDTYPGTFHVLEGKYLLHCALKQCSGCVDASLLREILVGLHPGIRHSASHQQSRAQLHRKLANGGLCCSIERRINRSQCVRGTTQLRSDPRESDDTLSQIDPRPLCSNEIDVPGPLQRSR